MNKKIDIELLKDKIIDALRLIKAYNLPAECERLGMSKGTEEEAYQSKEKYIKNRLIDKNDDEIFNISKK